MKYLYKHDIGENQEERAIRLGCAAYVFYGSIVLGFVTLAVMFVAFGADQLLDAFKPALQIVLLSAGVILWVWSPFKRKKLRVRIFASWLLIIYYGYMNRPELVRFRLVNLNKISKIEGIIFSEFFAHSFPYPDKPQLYLNRSLKRNDYDCVLVSSPYAPHKLQKGIAITIGNTFGQKVIFESDDVDACIQALKKASGLNEPIMMKN